MLVLCDARDCVISEIPFFFLSRHALNLIHKSTRVRGTAFFVFFIFVFHPFFHRPVLFLVCTVDRESFSE